MNSRSRDEALVTCHYDRAQFLSDVAWMGLDPEQAFSRSDLRRQRDRLMQLHHPDRGGSQDLAARINITYSRMNGWLELRLGKRSYLRMRRDKVLAREAARVEDNLPKHEMDTAGLYAAILGTAAALVGIGLTNLARRRR